MIYIAKFLHTTNQQRSDEAERRHGEFNLIIEADGKDSALEKFKERISRFRGNSELFEGRCFVYLLSLLEFDRPPANTARMFNYTSVAGDPLMPFISCTAPDGDIDGCRILNWQDNQPALDGLAANLFLKFDE